MPRKQHMSWEGKPAYRWVKMYRGVRYRVTCEELRAPMYTEEGSYKLANAWWERKLAELNKPDRATELLNRYQVADLRDTVAKGDAARRLLEHMTTGGKPTDHDFDERPYDSPEERVEVIGRLASKIDGQPRQEQTLGVQSVQFLETLRLSGMALSTYRQSKQYVKKLLTCPALSKDTDVAAINEQTVDAVNRWVRQCGQGDNVQRLLWATFKRFVGHLAMQRMCQIPLNLQARVYTIKVHPKRIKTYPVEEVRDLLASLSDRNRLYALLALNCGMYAADVASLRKDEYQNGRITRKRVKTKDQKTVPTVQYLLWPETEALLQKYPSAHPELVLTSMTGGPLRGERVDAEGKVKRYDLVSLQYARGRAPGRKASKPPIPLKALRSISATIIESHEHYGRYKGHFLGHAPRGIAERHYAAPSQDLFDKIILWLREQILGTDQKPAAVNEE